MSNDNKPKSNFRPQNKGKFKPGRGNGQRYGGVDNQHRGGNEPKDVPMLKWGSQNNFIEFKKKFSYFAGEKYQDVAHTIIKAHKRPAIPEIDPKDYPESEPHPKERFAMDYKLRMAKQDKMDEQMKKLFHCMMSYLSQESLDAINSEDGFEKTEDAQDAYELWELITTTHRIDSSKSENIEVTKSKVRTNYQRITQGAFESIISYKERFDEALRVYHDYGNPKLEDAAVAMDFLTRLDEARYGAFKINTLNQINSALRPMPKNVNEMFQLAKNYIAGSKFSIDRASGSVVFNTVPADDRRGNKNKNASKDSTKLVNGKQQQGTKQTTDTARRDKTVTCWGCGQPGHYKSDCPDGKKRSVDNDEAEELNEQVHLTSPDMVFATGKSAFKWNEVILDSGATISVVHPRLLTDLREQSTSCSGISGLPFELTHTGELDGFFQCHSSPKLAASVLSQDQIEQLYQVTYDQGRAYIVHLPDRDLVFKKRNRLYVGDMRDWDNGEGHHLYHTEYNKPETKGVKVWKPLPDSGDLSGEEELEEEDVMGDVMLTKDVTGLDLNQYTRAQVKDAKEAWNLIKNMGYLSKQEAIELVQDGNVFGLKLTSHDVERAFEIFGTPRAYGRGRRTAKTVARSPMDRELKDKRKEVTLYSDVSFVLCLNFLFFHRCVVIGLKDRVVLMRLSIHSLNNQIICL